MKQSYDEIKDIYNLKYKTEKVRYLKRKALRLYPTIFKEDDFPMRVRKKTYEQIVREHNELKDNRNKRRVRKKQLAKRNFPNQFSDDDFNRLIQMSFVFKSYLHAVCIYHKYVFEHDVKRIGSTMTKIRKSFPEYSRDDFITLADILSEKRARARRTIARQKEEKRLRREIEKNKERSMKKCPKCGTIHTDRPGICSVEYRKKHLKNSSCGIYICAICNTRYEKERIKLWNEKNVCSEHCRDLYRTYSNVTGHESKMYGSIKSHWLAKMKREKHPQFLTMLEALNANKHALIALNNLDEHYYSTISGIATVDNRIDKRINRVYNHIKGGTYVKT